MTAQDLKNSILQLAVQGKLVEQRAEEGTVKELIEQIGIEKERLIKEGKIKKEKPLPKIIEDEIPFEIPESWEWVRLGEISSYTGKIISILRVSERKISGDKIKFKKGDILYSKLRPYLLKILVAPDDGICTPELVPFTTYGRIENEYIKWVLKSPYINYIVNSVAYGVKMPRVGTETMVNLVIPLPPVVEQKRIVAKIEELFSYIEKYDSSYTKLKRLDKKFSEDMQKSIMQYALKGKLVDQRPEEGTGEELYRQIQAEKEILIKVGKIKAEKSLPEILDEEIPYKIPQCWCWVRLGELGTYKKGPFGSALTKSLFVPKGSNSVKVYEQKNAIKKDGKIGEYYITKDYFESKMRGFEVLAGDIIVSCAGTIGETYIIPPDCEQGIINQALMRIRLMPSVNVEYFLLYFDFILKDIARKSSKGSAIKNIPPFEKLKNYLVAFPPYGEQERIVKRLSSIVPYIQKINRKEG